MNAVNRPKAPSTAGLIFSKDRALQLHGLLQSLQRHCSDLSRLDVYVQYTTSTAPYETQYQALAQEFPWVSFGRETDFRAQVLNLLKRYESVLFLVDDNLFVEPFSMGEIETCLTGCPDCIGFSLRLGRNTTYCFSLDVQQQRPVFTEAAGNILKFNWSGEEGDFGYPLEVSSSVYRVADLLPILESKDFANPNMLEGVLASNASTLGGSRPSLLCYPTSRAFCVPLNLVQNVAANRHAQLGECSSEALSKVFEDGWRIAVEMLDGVVPQACHEVLRLPCVLQSAHGGQVRFVPSMIREKAPQLTFSVVVPCYNQGRFVTECLESLVLQSEPPAEVIVVNDGSTEEETKVLLERLPCYHYPFRLRVRHKPNGGLPSARNHGVALSTGDIVVPLDADDKLLPDALEAYRKAFTSQPAVDAFYPDALLLGQRAWFQKQPEFNAWRLPHDNLMVCSTAMRRRIFDAGFWYDERMRNGYSDWEFCIRAFALGPFKAAPLKKCVFEYRRLGFSMVSAVDRQKVIAQMREQHAEAGIWSADRERQLRKVHAPTHCLVSATPEQFADADDILAVAENDTKHVLEHKPFARFLWAGSFLPEATAHLQLIVNEVAKQAVVPVYLFKHSDNDEPFLIVVDRQWIVAHRLEWETSIADLSNIVVIKCFGHRQPAYREMARQRKLCAADKSLLKSLGTERLRALLPQTPETDARTWNDLRYYLARDPAIPRFATPKQRRRVLAIAVPNDHEAMPSRHVRQLLEEGRLRGQFDAILVLHGEHVAVNAPPCFESLADACLDLGNLCSDRDRLAELTLDLLKSSGVTDLLVAESALGYEMISMVRKVRLPIRINALICDRDAMLGMSPKESVIVAAEFANLLDRVASSSDALTTHMVDDFYFPAAKIKTITPSGQDYGQALIRWLFDTKAQTARVEFDSVLGANKAA